jgi:hypothetical protein
MAALSPEVKAFIVQALACFDTPTQIASQVKQEFGLDISIQQVSSYDPTKAIARILVRNGSTCSTRLAPGSRPN